MLIDIEKEMPDFAAICNTPIEKITLVHQEFGENELIRLASAIKYAGDRGKTITFVPKK